MRGTFVLLSALAIAFCAEAATPLALHIAPNGSDKWSGKLAAPNASRTDGPFATIERARDAVRELKRKQGGALKQPVTVYLRGGSYSLSEPVRFSFEDSGTQACPVTYAAYRDEKPVLTGGRSITGWKEVTVDGKRLWAAEIPAAREGKWRFHQLWVNGQRRVLARHPNEGFFRIAAVPDLDLKKPYQLGQERFQFNPGEIERWKNIEDVDLVLFTFWISSRRGIAALDEAQHMVTLDRRSHMRLTEGFGQKPALARYYVEGALELLDAPGEWYLNRKTGVLYYLPMPGERMENAEVVAPALDRFMTIEGKPKEDRHVEYLTFRGLAFAHSEWWLPTDGTADRYQFQGAASMPAAIQLSGARHCAFEACTIAHVSGYAMLFSRGCEKDRLVGSKLLDMGTGGVRVGEPDRIGNVPPGVKSPFPDDPKEETHDIEISDNEMRGGGRVFHQGHAVLVGQSYNNLIAHNHIHDFYQLGISVGWTWGYGKSLARGNVIEYNHIHNIGQRRSSDLGAIYTLGTQPGTVIRYNLLHDIHCADYIGRGIYLDEGSSDIVVENNVVYDTTTGGFGLNFGRRNTIRNNIFAFGELAQIEPSGNMNKPEALEGSSYVLERNIFYWQAGQNVLKDSWRPRERDEFVMRKNLYWRDGGGEVLFGPKTWAEWQASGFDAGSKIADPVFVDPRKGDFRLKPGSAAQQIGFQPFDLSSVGPRKGSRR